METATTNATKIADLKADAKLVYNAGSKTLIALADKYGVTTSSLTYWREKEKEGPLHTDLHFAALGSKSTLKEMQGKLYSTIKSQLRELGA